MIATPKSKAIQIARDIISREPLYLDTETTGTGSTAEIIEICIIDDDCQTRFESLVRPLALIPPDSTRIHGITNAMVQSAPTWRAVWPKIQDIIKNRLVAVYNADFDLRMMQQSSKKHKLIWSTSLRTEFFCIMKLYAQYVGDWNPTYRNYRWHSLERAGLQSNLLLENTHRACADTKLARALLHFIRNQIV